MSEPYRTLDDMKFIRGDVEYEVTEAGECVGVNISPEDFERLLATARSALSGETRTERLRSAATSVVAFWDSLDAVSEEDERPTDDFKAEMDRRIDALREELDQ